MTSSAANTLHLYVAGVIEFHPEAFETRKRFQGAGLHVRMADCANWALGIGKLLRVTARTRSVARLTGKPWSWSIALATMTKKARQTRMISAVMQKL